MNLTRVSLR